MTGYDFVRRALLLIGAIGAGETLDPDDAQDGLDALNDLVDSWRLDTLWATTITRATKVLAASTATYTIGSGGAINIERPDWIDAAGLILVTSGVPQTEIPIEVFTDQRWQGIPSKDLTAAVVSGLHYRHDYTAGLGTIELWPVPSVGTSTLVLYVPDVPITAFADGITAYTFAPGVKRAIRYNLAIELAPEHGRSVTSEIATIAERSLSAVKRRNQRPIELVADAGLLRVGRNSGTFNPYTGESR